MHVLHSLPDRASLIFRRARGAQAFPGATGQGIAMAAHPARVAIMGAANICLAARRVAAGAGLSGRFLTGARG